MAPTWLLLVHQLPASPTGVRVKVWRRLKELGAVSLKNSVWVLPASDQAREDLEWMKRDIEDMKGGAVVFAADSVDALANEEVVAAFRDARAADYRALGAEASRLAKRIRPRRATEAQLRQARTIAQRLTQVDAIAHFPPKDRDKAAAAVSTLMAVTRPAPPPVDARPITPVSRYSRRTWVTRPRPGIDRLSSAWLVRRFIDARARFAFADAVPTSGRAVAFDMYGAAFGHSAGGCTFETLTTRFGIIDPAVTTIGEIVHDLDLKEHRFGRPEAPAIGRLVDGLRAMYDNDHTLLEQGAILFEALYRAFGGRGVGHAKGANPRRRSDV